MNKSNRVAAPCSPWVSYWDPAKTYSGYTTFTSYGGSVIWMVDMEGRPVHCWDTPFHQVGGFHSLILPNGNMFSSGADLTIPKEESGHFHATAAEGAKRAIFEIDWDNNVVWKINMDDQHHDFFPMENGNVMFVKRATMPAEITATVKGGIAGSERDGVMVSDGFVEMNHDGEVVWEWIGHELQDPEIDEIVPQTTRAEWTHTNSCHVLPNGDIMTTFHHQNTIVIIDKKSGDIVWRWGVDELAKPHSPTLLANGNILVFDNGQHRQKPAPRPYSRVLEVNRDSGDIVWSYTADMPHDFYSNHGSGAQRLPNGNTLITESMTGRIFEVTRDGERVWEFRSPFYFPDDRGVFGLTVQAGRAYRYAPDYEGFGGRNFDPDRVELTLKAMVG